MVVTRILEKKTVIRVFGLALFLSPFFNTFASMAMRPDSPTKWTTQAFFKLVTNGTIPDHFLYISSAVIGLIMLGGANSAWKFVLFLLGGHITRQIFQLGENIRTHWIYGLFFLVNVSIFLFILDQLVWKQKADGTLRHPPKPKPAPEPVAAAATKASVEPPPVAQAPIPPATANPTPVPAPVAPPVVAASPVSPAAVAPKPLAPAPSPAPASAASPVPSRPSPRAAKKIMIHFDGVGPWAQLMSVTNTGILVRSTAQPPDDIDSREIEISMKNGLTLRTRLARQVDKDFFFEYTHLTTQEIKLLNEWLQQQAA